MITKDVRALLGCLNATCTQFLEGAIGVCVSRTHYEVGIAHLLGQMVEDAKGDAHAIFESAGMDLAFVRAGIQKELRSYKTGNSARPVFSPLLIDLLEKGLLESQVNLAESKIRSGALLLALRSDTSALPRDLQDLIQLIHPDGVRHAFREITAKSCEGADSEKPKTAGATGGAQAAPEGSNLQRFTTNFTELARQDKIDPIFGRDDEIRQAIDILCRRRKNNPIFIGEAGVGKTAVVEGLALKIVQGVVPDVLKGVEIMGIDLGLLSAGAGVRGEFENRLKGILREVKESATPIILFIDEAHTLIGAGGEAGKNDAANLLKPELARGELKCIAATTFTEFRKYFEKDPAMARRFQAVVVPEPDAASAAVMLRGVRERYEKFHGVRISHESIAKACEMSDRYIAGRQLPDKAVDLLDTAAARVKLSLTARPADLQKLDQEILNLELELQTLQKDANDGVSIDPSKITGIQESLETHGQQRTVLEERWKNELELAKAYHGATDRESAEKHLQALLAAQGENPLVHAHVSAAVIAEVISEWTGIPAGNMVKDDARVLQELESILNTRVAGQSWGIQELATTIRSAKMGLTKPESPMGVFLLTGPSGVGKTETAKAIADLLYGGEKFVVSLSMSEYQDSISVTQLKGASAGYVGYGDGGVLTEGVRKRPYTVVILDEIEKAHKDVLNMFYQVFDQGFLRDGEGRDINFRNTIILMTSNLGTDTICQMAMDTENSYAYQEYVEAVLPELTDHFMPALLARCKVVPYLPLGKDTMRIIAQIKLDKVARRLLATHGVQMACAEGLVDHLVEQCNLVQSGARLIDSLIDREILPAISSALVANVVEGTQPTHLAIGLGEEGRPFFRWSTGGFDV